MRFAPRGWAGKLWSPAVGAEHRACREAAAVFDESSFAKLDVVGPRAADFLESFSAINGEGALSDQCTMIHPLHALHRGDAMEIIPLLRATQEVRARVPYHYGSGHGLCVDRIGKKALDKLTQSIALDP